MQKELEKKALKHLSKIEGELEEIKERSPGSFGAFTHGILQGSGIIIGSILTILFISYALSIFGVIPGFGTIGAKIQDALNDLHR